MWSTRLTTSDNYDYTSTVSFFIPKLPAHTSFKQFINVPFRNSILSGNGVDETIRPLRITLESNCNPYDGYNVDVYYKLHPACQELKSSTSERLRIVKSLRTKAAHFLKIGRKYFLYKM